MRVRIKNVLFGLLIAVVLLIFYYNTYLRHVDSVIAKELDKANGLKLRDGVRASKDSSVVDPVKGDTSTTTVSAIEQHTPGPVDGENKHTFCTSFETKVVTDTNLLELYKECTKQASKPSIATVGPELFGEIFIKDNFRSVVCQDKNKTYISGREMIALTSIPGSGNTWTRLLIEDLTGIFWGALVCMGVCE